jgi:murein DD-endopeptidase MepM/ murein hydrolase activator NlpD
VVLAAGEGTVIAARGDVEDNSLGPDGVEFAPLPADPVGAIFGNHVVLDHGNSEFSVLGHLQFRSVDVEVGEQVEAKQPIGRLGLSGNTDFPHIHYQLQDGPDARTAEGLPFRFEGLAALEAGTTLDVE